jgi:hypothetical protein
MKLKARSQAVNGAWSARRTWHVAREHVRTWHVAREHVRTSARRTSHVARGTSGQIVEVNAPAEFFDAPQHPRTQAFLNQILD